MAFLHSLDREMPKFHLNSRHILIDSVSDNELCARLNMADAKFTFMDRAKNYHPQWMAPEVLPINDFERHISLEFQNLKNIIYFFS